MMRGWNSIKELPDYEINVLLRVQYSNENYKTDDGYGDPVVQIGSLDAIRKDGPAFRFEKTAPLYAHRVTHWMPLPSTDVPVPSGDF